MSHAIVKLDDKHVPVFRIVWISDVPHFCGEDDCQHEGDYEIRLDVDDSIWANVQGREDALEALEKWCDPKNDERSEW